MLPFDRDPGTAERFTELWAKAFKEVRLSLCTQNSTYSPSNALDTGSTG